MAVACLADTLVQKGILSHSDLSAALGEAENRIENSNDRKHLLRFSPFASCCLRTRQAKADVNFPENAELVGKLT